MATEIDAMALYNAWQQLDNGSSAQLRRVSEPDELRDIPAFYRFVQPFGWVNPVNQRPLLRMVFCLSAGKGVIRHKEKTPITRRVLAWEDRWQRAGKSMNAAFFSLFAQKVLAT